MPPAPARTRERSVLNPERPPRRPGANWQPAADLFVIRCAGGTGFMDLPGPGLPLGQSIEYFNLPPAASVGNCFTDAVALADGTTLGTPQGEIAGHDIFTMVFTSRARKAAEWSKFETFLNSLDGLTPGTALQSVYSYAAGLGDPIDATKLPVVRTADDWTKSQDLAAREWVRDSLQLSVRNFKIRRDQLHLSDEDAWRMFHDGMLKELAYADYSRFARRGAAR